MLKAGRVWKYSLGSFSDERTSPYDNYIAIVRTIIFVSYMVTNAFIVGGVVRHWGGSPSEVLPHRDNTNSCDTVSVDTKNIKK